MILAVIFLSFFSWIYFIRESNSGIPPELNCTSQFGDHHSALYLTNWGFSVHCLRFVWSASVVIQGYAIYISREKKKTADGENPDCKDKSEWHHNISWMLDAVTSTASIIITVIYYGVLYPKVERPECLESDIDFIRHGFNSIATVVELLVSAHPVRIAHAVYPMLFAFFYFVTILARSTYFLLEDWSILGILEFRPGEKLYLFHYGFRRSTGRFFCSVFGSDHLCCSTGTLSSLASLPIPPETFSSIVQGALPVSRGK